MADERIDSMGVPITGSQRDENLDALERRVRNQFEKPVQDAEEFIKFKILEALKDVESLDAPTKAVVAGLAVSREAKGNELFNKAVEQLNLPVEVQQIGNDFAASKQFQGVLGENSNLGVSAYRPESGDATLAAQVSKQYPGAFGRDSNLGFTGSVSTQGDPRFAVDARKEFRNPLGPNSDASIGAGYDSEAGPRFEARIQQTFSEGGRVNMNKPRITQGLTNLLNKYSTGPLAGAGNVSRETPVQPFNEGGGAYSFTSMEPVYDPLTQTLRPGETSSPTGAYQGQDNPYDPGQDPYGFGYNTEFGYGGGGGEGGAGSTNFSDAYLQHLANQQIYNQPEKTVVEPTPAAPLGTVDVAASTGPVTPAYTEPAVVETTSNFEDNPVTSVPVVTPASTTPATTAPLTSDLAVSTTPVVTTPAATTTPVAVSEPIPNPITYPTAPVAPAVAPPNYFVPEEERVETALPPSVYNPPAPPTESVYTPPAATVVDTPQTLFTQPETFAVPEAKPYNYLQELRPNFDISDVIKTQTGGYTPTQGMVINPTQYQYPGAPEITGDNVYVPEIYQSLPSLDLSTVDVEDLADTDAAEVGFDANTTIDYNDLNYGSGGFAPQRADYLPGGSFHMPGTEITGQEQYNVAYQQYEADFATRNGYTLEELRSINTYRINNGLPRLQDMNINTESGMS